MYKSQDGQKAYQRGNMLYSGVQNRDDQFRDRYTDISRGTNAKTFLTFFNIFRCDKGTL